MRWQQGRTEIDRMIKGGELQRVAPSREQAVKLLELAAILENQGLRATSRGGHICIQEAVRAQLDPPLGQVLRPFGRMRRTRNEAEYPASDSPGLEPDDVHEDLERVEAMINLAEKVLDQMSPF